MPFHAVAFSSDDVLIKCLSTSGKHVPALHSLSGIHFLVLFSSFFFSRPLSLLLSRARANNSKSDAERPSLGLAQKYVESNADADTPNAVERTNLEPRLFAMRGKHSHAKNTDRMLFFIFSPVCVAAHTRGYRGNTLQQD